MTSKSLVQRSERVLRFLVGMRHPAVAGRLARYGFDDEAYKEGWGLLREAAGRRFSFVPVAPEADPGFIEALDAWENQWYPILSAVLQRHHPAAHEQVFLNLRQTEGREVVVTVSTLLSRLDGLGAEVRESLLKRGLTDGVLAQARGLLAQGAMLAEKPPVDSEAARAEVDSAEQAMWAWYLEWSEIARAAIKDGRLLQRLGFNTRTRTPARPEPGGSEIPFGEEGDDADESAPPNGTPAASNGLPA